MKCRPKLCPPHLSTVCVGSIFSQKLWEFLQIIRPVLQNISHTSLPLIQIFQTGIFLFKFDCLGGPNTILGFFVAFGYTQTIVSDPRAFVTSYKWLAGPK